MRGVLTEWTPRPRGTSLLSSPRRSGPSLIQLAHLSTERSRFKFGALARNEPETPAADVLSGGGRAEIGIVVRAKRLLPPGERDRPFPPDIRI